ncbi:MAG: sigma 54-interacting transcriptional regulator [Bryobacterales bacterium]|nr:sigma 54-interacting transcriptional regulator [Bryobacterales bacterium]
MTHRARIMVVEDERITAEDLRDILTQTGYEVTAAVASGEEALRRAEADRPDLVLMDIRIEGGLDGLETARLLRQRLDIPVVYLTAHADDETLAAAKLSEPLGYIVKPFQEPELHATIEVALHKVATERESRLRQKLLEQTLSAMETAVITLDRDGRITLMNASAERWTGWRLSSANGRPFEEVARLIDHHGGLLDGLILHTLDNGTMGELPPGALLSGSGGQERRVSGTLSPILDHEGRTRGAVMVLEPLADEPEDERTAAAARASAKPELGGFDMVVESALMRQVVNFARRVAASEVSTILLEGESGTGKDVLAKFLHYHSARTAEPFLAINCAAIPETLLESELFGYEKGAFTDARSQKRGILELASNGTVFLDEIGELPLALQAKLLRVLEEQKFRRLGGIKDIEVNLRVVTATNRNLREAIEQGRFRLDLFYRLNVIQLTVPSLRERPDDILPLANHFLRLYAQRFKRDIRGLTPAAESAMLQHVWPGNVRELRNTIERAVVLEESSWVQPESLGIARVQELPALAAAAPMGISTRSSSPSLEGMSLEEAERTMLLNALEKTGWNQTQAAKLLDITRDTLRYKMKKYNLKSKKGE